MGTTQSTQDWLEDGETLLWQSRRQRGTSFRPRDLILIPMAFFIGFIGLMWLGLIAVSADGAPLSGFHLSLIIGGIALMAAAGLFTLIRFARRRLFAPRILYALTDRRALVLRGQTPAQSLRLKRGTPIQMGEREDGAGWVALGSPAGPPLSQNRLPGGADRAGQRAPKGLVFDGLSEPRTVYRLLDRTIGER